ncbi:MAG: hypothetical protein VYA20_03130 [Candidatus Neomarinimicrobiota bacterium]|nr:hypothetical protein [Candidatus Neomarinimicrobiota bacterium]
MKKMLIYASIFFFVLSCDEDVKTIISAPTSTYDMLPPEIVINAPETDSIYASGQSISFDISATDDFAIEGIFLEIGDTEILSEYFFDSPIGGLMPTEYDIDHTFDFTDFCSEHCSESSDNIFIVRAWVSDSEGRTSLDWIRVQFNYEEPDNDDSQ